MTKPIALAADHGGFELKEAVKAHLDELGLEYIDFGTHSTASVDYNRYFFSIGALCGTLDRRAIEREGESSLYQNNVTLSLGYMFR